MMKTTTIKQQLLHDKAKDIMLQNYSAIRNLYIRVEQTSPNSKIIINKNIYEQHFIAIGNNYFISKGKFIDCLPVLKYKEFYIFQYKKINYLPDETFEIKI